jgi:hypothetical protein
VATIVGSSMALLDSSVVNIALPAIQQALHAEGLSHSLLKKDEGALPSRQVKRLAHRVQARGST